MSSLPNDLPVWLDARREALDEHMADLFHEAWPTSFADPLRYPVFGGGKRVRPALCFAAYEAVAEHPDDLAPALHPAAAVELVHTYSLVHDDLPAMDDDDERRGRPTVHVAWDEATAVLVGDALLTEAFAHLVATPVDPTTRVELVRRLADAAGYRGMIGGQAADVGLDPDLLDADTLTRLHALKTGALLQVSAALGGLVAGASPSDQAALERVGRAVGLAFQLADDLLDADEDAGEGGPPSFVRLLGPDETRRRAQALADEAHRAADDLPRPDRLQQLARFVVERRV